MSYYFNTGVGSRHTVSFPEIDWTLDEYCVKFYHDDSRGSLMALVSLWHLEKFGGFSAEDLVVYNMPNPDEDKDATYKSLAEALKLSGKPWKVRKLWYSLKNRKLRAKLAEYGWSEK